jgi:hypothetical protein
MNERIEKLISQSFTDEQGERFDAEKFAHLIIEECAKLAEYQGYNQAFGLGGLRTKLHEYFEISRSDE